MKKFNVSAFDIFNKQWALVTAGNKETFNTMTIGWGGLGTLWGKPVATVYIKPVRYTYKFMEQNEYFTVSFFADEYKKDMGVLGSKSGRDCDKLSLTSLTPKFLKEGVSFEQAQVTLLCKKIYRQDIDRRQVPTDAIEKFYTQEEPHRMYIGEVIDIL